MLVKRRAPGGAAWIKLAVLLCVWLWTPVAGAAEQVALVIGNSDYQYATRLNNPGNDARDLSVRLRALGFQVTTAFDLDKPGLERAGATRSIGRGLGRNSPYTAALLEVLEEPGVEVGMLFRRVRDRVLEKSGNRQEPFIYGSVPGYQTQRRWYELGAGDRVIEVSLERLPERPVVSPQPLVTAPPPVVTTPPVATAATGLIEGRYRISGRNGEIVHDTVTGLEWQRCSLGQIWYDSTCNGEAARYTWEEAGRAQDWGWRLPTIKELQTLVYCSSGRPARFNNSDDSLCLEEYQRPTIVDKAFPNTPSSYFWSASPSAGGSDGKWGVNFGNGFGGRIGTGASGRLRLVRGGQ